MRFLSLPAAAALIALAAAPGNAALPDPAADCTTFTTVQAVDGQAWEIRGFVCMVPGRPPKVEVTHRRATDPSATLKQRLIW